VSDRGLGDYCPSPERKLTVPLVLGCKDVLHQSGKADIVVTAVDSYLEDDEVYCVEFKGTDYVAYAHNGVFPVVEDILPLSNYHETTIAPPKPEPKPEPRAMVVRRPMIQVDGVVYDDLDDLDEYICANLHIGNAEDRQMIREILDAVDEFEKGV